MTNPYYNGGAFPATGAPATSASMRAELSSISSGFDKLPTLSGNASKLIAVNSSASALEAVSVLPPLTITDTNLVVEDNADSTRKFRFEASGITAGATRILTVPDANLTLVGTDTVQTLTNKTFNLTNNLFTATSAQLAAAVTDETGTGSLVFGTNPTISGATLTGGSLNNTPIGASTPNTGAFTTLSASSTVSGAGFSTYLASPPAIGGTTPAAGSFTTLSASSSVTLSGGTANGVLYLNGSKVATSGSALTFDGTTFNAPTLTTSATATFGANVYLGANALYYYAKTSGGSNIRMLGINAGNSAYVGPIDSGPVESIVNASSSSTNIQFYASGTEGMRLTSTGLGIGTSSPAQKLVVSNAGAQGIEFDPTNGIIQTYNRSGVAYFDMRQYASQIRFFTGSSPVETMRLDSSGNLGIGTTTINYRVVADCNNVANNDNGISVRNTDNSGYGGSYNFEHRLAAAGAIARRSYISSEGSSTGSFMRFATTDSGGTLAERMRLDPSGNLGLGVTPSAWGAGFKAIQANRLGFQGDTGNGGTVVANAYFDGSAWRYINTGFASNHRQASGQHEWFTAPSGTAGNTISFTQAMTLDASGNLGLGATSISALGSGYTTQVISGTNGGGIRLYAGATEYGRWYADGSVGMVLQAVGASTPTVFYTNGSERARITSGGDLLVGTTTGLGRKIVVGGTTTTARVVPATDNVGSVGDISYRWEAIYAVNGTIQTSDAREKTAIQDSDLGLNFIAALRPVHYKWNANYADQRTHYGLIAQEVKAALPGDVDFGGLVEEENDGRKSLAYNEFIAPLIKAIQEQQAIIEDLRARVAALEAQP